MTVFFLHYSLRCHQSFVQFSLRSARFPPRLLPHCGLRALRRYAVQRYSGLKDWIPQYIRKDDNILMVGAGNSRLTEDMFDDGYTTITNIDISKVVVDQMTARCR